MTYLRINLKTISVNLGPSLFFSEKPCLSRQVPVYLADDCCLVFDSTRRSLQSADVPTCVVPRTLISYGDRTFAATGPRLWNSLPVQLCNPYITYGQFRRQLKGHLFQEAWTWCSVNSDMRHLRRTLTYLLTISSCSLLMQCDVLMCISGHSSSRQLAPRLFCDICDMFDLHDTDDCPQQGMSTSPPASQHHGCRNDNRPYCTTCEGLCCMLVNCSNRCVICHLKGCVQ